MNDSSKIKETLNLPRTSFSMKAKLAVMEPEFLKKWEDIQLYAKIQKKREQSQPFVLHDGPPYANGNIHLGTALNKILKDFIIKSKSMEGFKVPYVPGWDCHGLPIEIKVDQILKKEKKNLSILGIREECRKYALKFVGIQKDQFKRLGVFGEWDNPYLTMNPEYEAEVVRYLASFFETGNVFKGKKPVYWCIQCRTALAEAEIEYKDRKSPSIYVKFPLDSDLSEKFPVLKGKKVSVLIWTTTPWTLPANLAIVFHPDYEYAAFDTGKEVHIAAKRLIPFLADELGFEKREILVTFHGKDIEGMKARHPFIDRESVFLLADYVTLDQGTGCVHSAPGHGQDDYQTGSAYGLEVYAPVDSSGCFTNQVEHYAKMNVFESNAVIMSDMQKQGSLLKSDEIEHSYPHCWRCKQPVIFRATSQWFISLDAGDLRKKALDEIKKIEWIPSWGEERISNMIEARPDWCISRQRSWGVPIPAFYCQECDAILADRSITLHVADIFEKEGANVWYEQPAEKLLPPGTKCPECSSKVFHKENNILDVWFESGSSHNVLGKRKDQPFPSDIYIEGHDQHRGWFNSSLLVGIAAKGRSPYKTCITHGFVLDEKGKGMSKSLGNYVDPDEIISRNGAEILRLWVAMLNYKEDAKYGKETIQRLVEAYRKIRNTWRFLLGNLYDFNPDTDLLPPEEMEDFDLWIMDRFKQAGDKAKRAYESYEYHIVYHTLYHFFTVDLSSLYLDVLKDRLYCSGKTSKARKSAQTSLFLLLRGSLMLLAPILPFTTDEAWEAMPDFKDKLESVHLADFPDFDQKWLPDDLFSKWEIMGEIREEVLKELEKAREHKVIGNSLEAMIVISASGSRKKHLDDLKDVLPSYFIVSAVELITSPADDFSVEVKKAPGSKCRRCWMISPYVGTSPEMPEFCQRCESVVMEAGHEKE